MDHPDTLYYVEFKVWLPRFSEWDMNERFCTDSLSAAFVYMVQELNTERARPTEDVYACIWRRTHFEKSGAVYSAYYHPQMGFMNEDLWAENDRAEKASQ
jgi:hypothetical protein